MPNPPSFPSPPPDLLTWQDAGSYRVGAPPAPAKPDLAKCLHDFAERFHNAEVMYEKSGIQVRPMQLDLPGASRFCAVKRWPAFSAATSRWYRHCGSPAARSLNGALLLEQRHIGVVPGRLVLEHWGNGRLIESFYIADFVDPLTSMRDEWLHLLRNEPEAEKLEALLQTVSRAIRTLHDRGILHRDLGNQNILLDRRGERSWGHVRFTDLNRLAVLPDLSRRHRALDISRLTLPSDWLRIFCQMYFEGPVPASFAVWERSFRRLQTLRTRSRIIRHPVRTHRRRKHADPAESYPADRDLWIWDRRSGQAVSALRRSERKKQVPASHIVQSVASPLAMGLSVRGHYRALRRDLFSGAVPLAGRWGVAIDPGTHPPDARIAALRDLGIRSVCMRFYHHSGPSQWTRTADTIHALTAEGFNVSAAMVQDRQAVTDPPRWRDFCQTVRDAAGDRLRHLQLGVAVNRFKWGVHSWREYRQLAEIALEEAPALPWIGPACIDFEYHHLAAFLRGLPDGFRFHALAHLLYVDRRGGPENTQGGFDLIHKAALARAFARASSHTADRLIITEANWPLAGTGVYSPVNSPYLYPGQTEPRANVSEGDYAAYMIRYLLLATCSGMADQVFWWRLAAHGFGIMDETDAGDLRPRPAYRALKSLLHTLGTSTFRGRLSSDEGEYHLLFERPDGEQVVASWHPQRPAGPPPGRSGGAVPLVNPDTPACSTGLPHLYREYTPPA